MGDTVGLIISTVSWIISTVSWIINTVRETLLNYCYCTGYGVIGILLVIDLSVGVVASGGYSELDSQYSE